MANLRRPNCEWIILIGDAQTSILLSERDHCAERLHHLCSSYANEYSENCWLACEFWGVKKNLRWKCRLFERWAFISFCTHDICLFSRIVADPMIPLENGAELSAARTWTNKLVSTSAAANSISWYSIHCFNGMSVWRQNEPVKHFASK